MAKINYEEYTKDDLIRLIRERDRKPKFGLVWERDEIDHDKSLNDDFVVLDHDTNLSVGEAPHQNLIIEGDNFDALRYLKMTHSGKVKCIYIDPPYNTGNKDFIYNDRFIDKDDVYKHSKWLEFMYRRLTLAKDLLTEDGVIFVSIDDNEMLHLGMLMEKVFGAANFIGNIVWKNVTDNNPTRVTVEHEYILVYAVDINSVDKEWKSQVNIIKETLVNIGENLVERYGDTDELRTEYQRWFKENKEFLGPLDRYKYIDGGGIYTGSQSVHNPGKEGYRYDIIHPETKKPCKQPLNGYRFPQETMDKMLAEGRILFGQDESKLIEIKLYAKDYKEKLPGVIDLDGRKGPNELKNIFGDKSPFNNPKPTELILELLKFACGKNDIVLDFFAGSGSTAHAVMKLNAQDGGDRKYILVCSTEATNDEPDKNVCRNVCAERVRRVTQGYTNKKGEHVPGLGGSFAYLSTRRIPLDQVFHDVKHDQIWLALQLIHLNTITPYTPDNVTQVSTNGADKIAYVSKLTEESMAEVQAVAEEEHGNLTIYSWQPGMLRQHIQLPRITFETIPQYLIDRFSVGAAR